MLVGTKTQIPLVFDHHSLRGLERPPSGPVEALVLDHVMRECGHGRRDRSAMLIYRPLLVALAWSADAFIALEVHLYQAM